VSSLRERVGILHLEGMALNGFIASAKLEKCGNNENNLFRITAVLYNGNVVETECTDHDRISRTFIVITRYREWGKVLAKREYTEEMMKGITYDLDHEKNRG